MTGRAYMGEVLIQIWFLHEEMSELLDKQVNVQKESLKKTSGVYASSRKPTKKVCDENERKKKQLPRKNFCGDRKDFIKPYQKNR